MSVTMPRTHVACAVAGMLLLTKPADADGPRVVASITPVHALVAGVMADVGVPTLMIEGGGSPHTYTLRPSEAAALQDADVVFWIGEALETFLAKPLQSLAEGARVVPLAEAAGVELLPYRDERAWEAHGAVDAHGDHHDGDHADHGHSEHHDDHAPGDQEHVDHGHEDQGHDGHGHQGHDHGRTDMHIWLDPVNARAMVTAIVATLSEVDPANAPHYRAHGAVLDRRLADLEARLRRELAPVADRRYIVFHDAYRYFEDRFGLNPVGAITVSPDRKPGPRTVYDIRHTIIDAGAACVFSEPQFEPALVRTVVAGTGARTGVLDPLGADREPGPDAYVTLMKNLAASLKECLGAAR